MLAVFPGAKRSSGSVDLTMCDAAGIQLAKRRAFPLAAPDAALRQACATLVPRGVYRFAAFEGADAWMSRAIVRTLVRRRSRISPRSIAP